MNAQAAIFEDPVAYGEGVRIQKKIHAARLAKAIPDTLLVMQHQPVITLGRRGRDNYLTVDSTELENLGIDYHVSSRGGDITCHGPGQWVLYPIIKLEGQSASARGYLWNLEEIAIRTASDFGVCAYRREGMNGAWTDEGKIAAIGFHIKRWVTLHGMSFNAAAVPEGFSKIVPCGLEGQPVAALKTILGPQTPSMDAVAERLLQNFGAVCGRDITLVKPSELASV